MEEKIYVTKPSMPPIEEYITEIQSIWDEHILTNMGPKHKKLEAELTEYLKVPHVSLMVNGHMALEMAIQAMNLTGEVITTPFTFASTTHAIVRNGLKPVFCDIDPLTCTIDADRIEGLITDRTSAILPVHVYGNVCNVEKIDKIAKKYGLKVIYDAAHAFGEEYKGIGIGNFGNASMFSFHATKVFNTIEGGAVCYSDEDFGLDLYRLKNFGIRGPEKVDYVGANAKMNEFQAAMGLCNLRHVNNEIAKREKVYGLYVDRLKDIEGVRMLELQKDVKHNYSYLPIIIDENEFGLTRNEVFDLLAQNNIYSRKYFYPITNSYNCLHGQFKVGETPIALHISKRVLTLPMYADLTEEQIDIICSTIRNMKKCQKSLFFL